MTFLLFYTDPGSGAMLLQVLLATIAGVGFYFRSFVFRFFSRSKPESAETVNENEDQRS